MTSPADPTERLDLPTVVHRPTPPPMRASDADRTATVLELQDGVARGCLTPDEGSERMERAFAAVFLHDLPPLTVDLPKTVVPARISQMSDRLPGWLPDSDRARLVLVVLGTLVLLVMAGSVVAHLVAEGGRGPFPGGPRRF